MYIGIDIGGTNIKGVLTDKNGKIISSGDTPTPESEKKIDKSIVSLIESLASDAKIKKEEIDAIGIGAAGSIDRRKGMVITSPNILCWKNYPLAANIEKISGIKTFLENDATVACAGFWWESEGSKFRNFVMVTLGTGIGGGAVIDGRLFTGQNGSSLEIGHMTIDINGKECTCGNRGCLEQYASATALVNYTKSNLKKFKNSSLNKRIKEEKLSAKMIYEEALKKDELAVKSFEYISLHLGAGISNIINIFNPEAVVLGGGLSNAHKLIIPIVKKTVSERAMKGMKEGVKILAVKDQSIIPALGAAKTAMDRLKHIM
ncbi:MAG TPA: ROK family protein [Spirochaetota bacterium]|nr:ROK family protein [Spirochaetota bacterium]HPS86505.1 ROK family protein [Spirochaetota bacterium]